MPRLLASVLIIVLTSSVALADWNRFRGPNGSGTVEDSAVPLEWSTTENLLWSVEVPGIGHSSPVVAGYRVFLQSASRDGSKRMMICLSTLNGSTLWTREVDGRKVRTHARNSLASSTPTVDGQRVYGIFWTGDKLLLNAYSITGRELWSVSLGGYVSQHGAGLSPVVHDGKVYVNYDQDGSAEFVCFDAATGKRNWSASHKAFRACSSSPLVRDLPGGKKEIVNVSTAGLTGYDPDTGAVNWDWTWTFPTKPLRTVGSPILASGKLVAIAGDGDGSRAAVAVEPGSSPRVLWQKDRRDNVPYVPCPLSNGEHVFWINDTGFVVCMELATGKVAWSQRVFQRGVTASPVLVNGHIIGIDEAGRAIVFKATAANFEKVAQNDLDEPVFASPAVAGGMLFIRGTTHLFCIGHK